MDCNMPFIDGYETTQRIRQLLYDNNFMQPIISAVTGHDEQIYIKRAINSGMNQVISKPVND
jgi:CheY-like chemotaxis protein